MRVVHLACVAPPEIGGIGMAAYREVVGLRSRSVDAVLIAPTGADSDPIEGERSFVEHVKPYLRVGNASILPLVHPSLRQANVIHLHYPFFGTAERVLLRRPSAPIVVTFHMDAVADGWKGWLFSLHQRIVQSWLLRRAAMVLVSSFDYTRQSSLASFFVAHPERVRELPFGLDTDFFCPGPTTRERFYLPDGSRMILFVGGLDRAHVFKGLPVLLEAMTQLDASTHLVVVSDGELRARYEEQARSMGIAGRVHFMGRVDQQTLRDAYRSADVLAFPSTSHAEAFGLVALEAQACGTPVVASSLPGVRTVVSHGETGLLVPPGDVHALVGGLKTILSDDRLRQRLAEQARTWTVERFSWDRHIDELRVIYQDICDSPS